MGLLIVGWLLCGCAAFAHACWRISKDMETTLIEEMDQAPWWVFVLCIALPPVAIICTLSMDKEVD